MKLVAIIVAGVLGATVAFAQDLPEDSAARAALAQGDYARVTKLYEQASAGGGHLSDMAHYRLAIAYSKLAQPEQAWQHLSEALRINPQGSFATTAARLAELRSTILAACEKGGAPGCTPASKPGGAGTTPAATPPGTAVAAAPATPAGPAAPAAPAGPATVDQPAPASTAAPAARAPRPAAASTPQPLPASVGTLGPTEARLSAQSSPTDLSQWLAQPMGQVALVQLLMLAVLLLLVGWIALKVYRRDRRIPAGLDGLEALRDNVASLLVRLGAAGAHETVLYRQLGELLPHLEQEAGRTLYRASGRTDRLVHKDRHAVQLAATLSRQPLDVLSATPMEIQALFQRPAI